MWDSIIMIYLSRSTTIDYLRISASSLVRRSNRKRPNFKPSRHVYGRSTMVLNSITEVIKSCLTYFISQGVRENAQITLLHIAFDTYLNWPSNTHTKLIQLATIRML